jgi:hypothetical protein
MSCPSDKLPSLKVRTDQHKPEALARTLSENPRSRVGLVRWQTIKMTDEASYLCGACGEEIVIPIDLSQGERQE